MLAHRLFKSHRTGRVINGKWLDFKYPPNVGYDVLHSLKLMTDLGVVSDTRLCDALDVVESKMARGGLWLLDRVPRGWSREDASQRTIQLEKAGRPSKWITLQSLIVLSHTRRTERALRLWHPLLSGIEVARGSRV